MAYITISGEGGGIDFETEIIKRALEAEGIQVTVESNWMRPAEDLDKFVETIRERLRGPWGGEPAQPPIKKLAHIKVTHIPWGG